MRNNEIQIGKHYIAKVNGSLTVVEIEPTTHGGKGWCATNLRTGRGLVLRTAGRLRREATASEVVEAERYRRGNSC